MFVCVMAQKYIIKINPNYIFMLEKTENNTTGTIKQGDLFNIFNPEIQIDVDELVWKLRKYINKKIFFVENIILSVEMKHSPIRFILCRAERQKVVFAMYMIKGEKDVKCMYLIGLAITGVGIGIALACKLQDY